jgi:cytochrome c oxidase cbb3-type subunit 3
MFRFGSGSPVPAAAVLLIVALAGSVDAQRPATQRPPARTTPARPAGSDSREAIARRLCSQCHPFEFVVGVSRTREQWEGVVENMVGRGARGTRAELAAVVDYLSENHVLKASTVRGGSGPDDKPIVDPKAAEAAKPLYTASCVACHGRDARGTAQGPNLVRSLVVLHDRYGDKLGPYLRISHPRAGKPAGSGSPFEALNNREVLLLAHFLRERIDDTLRGAPMFKPGNILVGDSGAGAEYFRGEGGCAQCHSPTGDLAGIGRRLEPVNLQQRFLFPQPSGGRGRGRGAATKPVTVTLTTESGETLTGALDRMDDFNVSFHEASGNYRSIRRTPGTRIVKDDPLAAHVALLSRITDKQIHDVVAYLEGLK